MSTDTPSPPPSIPALQEDENVINDTRVAGSNNEDDDYHNAILGEESADTSSRNMQAIEIEGAGDEDNGRNGSNRLSTPKIQSGLGGASANLVNSIVGAGIIGIPYAFKQSGLLAGIFLLGLVAYMTDKSLRIIVGLASFHPKLKSRNVRTFEDLASYPFGQPGSAFILFNMFILAYGAMVAYLLIIKDTVPTILGLGQGGNSLLERNLVLFVTSLGVMLPLSMQRDMASLALTSILSVSADIVLVFFIAFKAPVKETVSAAGGFGQVLKEDAVNPTLFIGLGILSTAMACQHSAFIVSGSLANKTMRRWSIVTGFSIALSAALCAILGITGYLGFLENTEGDVLNNFHPNSSLANAARFLLAITMFFTYPMESFVARHVLVMLFHDGDMDGTDDPNYTGENEAGGYFGLNRRQTWTVLIYILTLIPALIVSDIGPVLSITGSLGGSCISYIAPGLVYIGLNGEAFLSFTNGLLENSRFKKTRPVERPGGVTEADLPVAGNVGHVLSTSPGYDGRKPFWWYLAGFPIWCAIASTGSINIKEKISGEDGDTSYQEHSTPETSPSSNNNTENRIEGEADGDVMVPTRGEFCMAIFFIMFGSIGAIAGIASNLYMQLKGTEIVT